MLGPTGKQKKQYGLKHRYYRLHGDIKVHALIRRDERIRELVVERDALKVAAQKVLDLGFLARGGIHRQGIVDALSISTEGVES